MKKISLSKTPIFLEFLKRFIKYKNYEDLFEFDMEKELFITGYCKCGQKDCATVYLKRIKEWEEKDHIVNLASTTKGLVLLHIEENGLMEFEALEYTKYPYKNEIKKVFKWKKSTLTPKDKEILDNYFRDLAPEKLNCITIDDDKVTSTKCDCISI